MNIIKGKSIYLSVLEREHCRVLYSEDAYDFALKTEPLQIGYSIEGADEWFEDIQKKQGKENLRLGIFLHAGEAIGDVALQGIDWRNRSCSLGVGIAKMQHRGKGYGQEAIALLLDYAFCHLGLERVAANTLAPNIPAQRALEKCCFVLEGRQRAAVYFAGTKHDRLNYAILADEYTKRPCESPTPPLEGGSNGGNA